MRVVGQGGDGGTVDIGFACLSGMFERNDDVLYICYDNEAYFTRFGLLAADHNDAERASVGAVRAEEITVGIGHGKKAARCIDAWLHGDHYAHECPSGSIVMVPEQA